MLIKRKQAEITIELFAKNRQIRRQYRHTGNHGLRQHQTQAFLARRNTQQIECLIKAGRICHMPGQINLCGDTERLCQLGQLLSLRPLTNYHQAILGMPPQPASCRFDQQSEALFLDQSPYGPDYAALLYLWEAQSPQGLVSRSERRPQRSWLQSDAYACHAAPDLTLEIARQRR